MLFIFAPVMGFRPMYGSHSRLVTCSIFLDDEAYAIAHTTLAATAGCSASGEKRPKCDSVTLATCPSHVDLML